jgi:hypothetical protein
MGVDGGAMVRMRMRMNGAGTGRVFWADEAGGISEDRAESFEMVHDGQWREYAVPIVVTGRMTRLRVDVDGEGQGEGEIDWIRVERRTLHPIEVTGWRMTEEGMEVGLTNRGGAGRTVRVNGKAMELAAGATGVTVVKRKGEAAVETVVVRVESEGLPTVVRRAVVHDEAVEMAGEMIESKELRLVVAKDGSGARVYRGGKLAAVIAPLMMREGEVVKLRVTGREGRIEAVSESGEERMEMGLTGEVIEVRVEAKEAVEAVAVRVAGVVEQGLFAGVEYLGRGEVSSSKLDIETAAHVRYRPDDLWVTWPLMAVVTEGASAAVMWNHPEAGPVYAVPNVYDGTGDHRMALTGRRIEAAVRVGGGWSEGERLERAGGVIEWGVKQMGLLRAERVRSGEEQRALELAGFEGPLRTEEGWGHCGEAHWKRAFFGDLAAGVWRLTGQVPQTPTLVRGGGHIGNDAVFLLSGRAKQWLDAVNGQAAAMMKRQQADGSFRYSGKYGRGHFEDTASGFVGKAAEGLLEHAWWTGDEATKAAGLAAVAYARKFRTPRGAQTWEVPLHTPDVLASAHLTRANVLAYRLTGDGAYLVEARRWAVTGLPFVYLRGDEPVVAYASIAVLGATDWRAPNWMGLPVQWCGLVYGDALLDLAEFDSSMDWRRIAEGLLIAGQRMQHVEGPLKGLLPDAYEMRHGERRPWTINPSALVFVRERVEGREPGLRVAVSADGRWRVVSPYGVRIEGAQAVIEGAAGQRYQVVINGRRIVEVVSKGRDVVGLE